MTSFLSLIRSSAHVASRLLLAGSVSGVGVPIGAAVIARPSVTHAMHAGLIGLSFESDEDSGGVNSGRFDDVGELPALLDHLGPGGTLRFGGSSVDRSYAGVTPSGLDDLRRLADATGWQVLYSVNLGHFSASGVRRDASAVARALGPHLSAIACGNEPNFYSGLLRSAHRRLPDYFSQERACLTAVHQAARGVRLAGPDTVSPGWIDAASGVWPRLDYLDAHFYPMSECGGRRGSYRTLLSSTNRRAQDGYLADVAAIAAKAHRAWQLTETNSAACGGITGVSNTFASALWVLDYVLDAASHGARGVDFHTSISRECDAYSVVCDSGAGNLVPRPIYYGLLAAHLLGSGDFYNVRLTGRSDDFSAYAVRSRRGEWRLALDDMGSRTANVVLRVPQGSTIGSALVWHLTAPSPTATGGVAIQGRTVGAGGAFSAPSPDQASCHKGTCTLIIAPYSAQIIALV